MFGLTIVGSIAATTLILITSPESNILSYITDPLRWKALTGDIIMIFKLQDIYLLNNFEASFEF